MTQPFCPGRKPGRKASFTCGSQFGLLGNAGTVYAVLLPVMFDMLCQRFYVFHLSTYEARVRDIRGTGQS